MTPMHTEFLGHSAERVKDRCTGEEVLGRFCEGNAKGQTNLRVYNEKNRNCSIDFCDGILLH